MPENIKLKPENDRKYRRHVETYTEVDVSNLEHELQNAPAEKQGKRGFGAILSLDNDSEKQLQKSLKDLRLLILREGIPDNVSRCC